MKVGFIGLGIMGKPMAKNLLKAGYQVCVNDFHKEAVEELVAAGATAGANNAEVAKGVDVVITMVPNSPNVRAALLGENGVAEGADKDTVVIDMSSIDPVESKKIAAELKERTGMEMFCLLYTSIPRFPTLSGYKKGFEGYHEMKECHSLVSFKAFFVTT